MTYYQPKIGFDVGDRITFDDISVYVGRQDSTEQDMFHVEINDKRDDGSVDFSEYDTELWHLDEFADRAAQCEVVTVEYAKRNVRTPEMNP